MLVQLAPCLPDYLPPPTTALTSGGGGHLVQIDLDQVSVAISVHRDERRDRDDVSDRFAAASGHPAAGTTPLRMRVVSAALYDHLDRIQTKADPDDVLIVDPRLARDPAIVQLTRSLVAADEVGQGLETLHAGAVGLAIVTRLLDMRRDAGTQPASRPKTALPKWRLKRAVAYVDANLARYITLADLAKAAGLSRMHFAAQFRAATGVRPREYVLRRRTERACELLREPDVALVDVALSVGFQTQAHFTTVFRRFVGETPHRWRLSNAGKASAPGRPAAKDSVATYPGMKQGGTEMRQDRREDRWADAA